VQLVSALYVPWPGQNLVVGASSVPEDTQAVQPRKKAGDAVENALRSIAVGRKNWLHLGSDRGGRTAAVLMCLVQACKRLGNEPFTLDRVSTHPARRIDDLLPDRRVLPGPPEGRCS
jgi:hypothetical protein